MKRFLCGLVALGVLLAAAGMTKADYTFTTLDVPGSIYTQANGINDSGQIVGLYEVVMGFPHGFLLSGRNYTTFDGPNSTPTEAVSGINASGQIVGTYVAGGTIHGFLLSGGN